MRITRENGRKGLCLVMVMDEYSGDFSKHNYNHLVIYTCGSGEEEGTVTEVAESGGASPGLPQVNDFDRVIESSWTYKMGIIPSLSTS